MALLVYCIMHGPVDSGGVITGIQGAEVSFVVSGDLCAAVSETPSRDGAPPVADLLDFGKVVEVLHRRMTVIPMRYGCFRAGIPELQDLLQEKASEYETLLKELNGQVEMGIRILLPGRAEKPLEERQPVTGRDYLAVRRAHFGLSEEMSRRHKQFLDRYNHAFSGLYSTFRTESGERGGHDVVSLYYLIPESAVCLFREAFAQVAVAEGAKALVSGPWPPYSFATPNLRPVEVTDL